MGLLDVSSWTGAIDHYTSQSGLISQFTLGHGLSVAALAAGVSLYWLNGSDGKKQSRYGPGPKGVPILGSAGNLPTGDQPWVNYMQWARKYGDFIYMTILGQPTYLISSFKTAKELMDKRAMIYSDRPIMVMAQKLVGWTRSSPIMTSSSDPHYSRYRKLFHTALRKERVKEMAHLQEKSSQTMLQLILDNPDDFVKHIRYCIGAVITKITYDHDMKPEGDEFVALAEKSADTFSQSAVPGAWLVDIFPSLQYVPSWFPGAKFKRTAEEWKAVNDYLHTKPYNNVKAAMAAGTHHGSITSRLLSPGERDEPLTPEEENRIMWVVGAIYAGADNAVSALTTFVLAMVMFPEAQRKAQDEIDRVLGTGRFPLMTDRQRLPYVEALFKEVLRWHPVVPLGVPHRLTQDDQWQEYTLPKGSTIIPNIFAMGHTEDDSNDFKPERHLDRKAKIDANEEYNDPTEYVFGFGRRVCPGKDLADASVWLGIANLLAAFNFSKKSDGKGGFVDVKDEYTPGIISHPKPFECSIVPRLSSTPALVHSTCADDH